MQNVISFLHELDKYSSKKDIALALLNTLNSTFVSKFSSFVVKNENSLGVLCQSGDSKNIRNIFSKEMCQQIYVWVMKQKQIASLKIAEKEQFVFIPLFDRYKEEIIEHGMLVFHLGDSAFDLNKESSFTINILTKLSSLSMTKFLEKDSSESYLKLQENIKSELSLAAKLQRSMSGSETNKKILFSVLEDESSAFNGNLWWISELGADINLVLIAQILYKGAPSAMLGGYLLGEMNGLKTRAEISLKPQEVLKYLNQQLHSIYKSTAITVNAWYGVFNIGARKVRFANANHPDPFLIGPEQEVSNLIIGSGEKGKPLGVSMDSIYAEGNSYISSGSKLIICTRDLLEHAAKVGHKYDPTWLPQVLETISTLSLTEMRNSLESILSEKENGTAQKPSRLALLLEIPS